MILKDGADTMLYMDIRMFGDESYADTLFNVFKTEYESNKTKDIKIYIKCEDGVNEMRVKGGSKWTPSKVKDMVSEIAVKIKIDSLEAQKARQVQDGQKEQEVDVKVAVEVEA